MAKPKLEQITIRPSKNGGHVVRHQYLPAPKLMKGGMSGGMMMDQASPEEHTFGAGDHKGLLKHITAALSLRGMDEQMKNSAKEPAEE